MKAKLVFVVSALFMASCSTPKYSYKFDYHDYNAGRKDKDVKKEVASNPGPIEIQPEMLVAEAPVVEPITNQVNTEVGVTKDKSRPLTISKTERKELIKDVKQALRQNAKIKKAGDVDKSAKALDHDLKLALIFLIVALASGLLYWISPELAAIVGFVALVISIVFFIKWLLTL